jgi:hypothetical protein
MHETTGTHVSGQLKPIERVVPGFFNTFLFTYYASEYRHVLNGIEFCCETPVIEHVAWADHQVPQVQRPVQVIQCRFLFRLPKASHTRNGVSQVFYNVMMDVPVTLSLINRHTIQVSHIGVDVNEPILYDSLSATLPQSSLVGMIQDMFATFNRLAPLETNIPVE